MRSRHRIALHLVFALVLGAGAALAQDEVESHPGYFALDELELVDTAGASVDINLRGAMLRLVGAAVLQEEPALAELVSDLAAIRVLVTPVDGLRPERVDQAFNRAGATLDARGWQRIVKVRDADEQVHVYVREVDGDVEGLTLFVFEPGDELTLINLVGRIDVEQLASIGRAFDIPTLEGELGIETPRPEPADERR